VVKFKLRHLPFPRGKLLRQKRVFAVASMVDRGHDQMTMTSSKNPKTNPKGCSTALVSCFGAFGAVPVWLLASQGRGLARRGGGLHGLAGVAAGFRFRRPGGFAPWRLKTRPKGGVCWNGGIAVRWRAVGWAEVPPDSKAKDNQANPKLIGPPHSILVRNRASWEAAD